MRPSTERALRWFLLERLNEKIFMITMRNADINQPMHSPPDKLSKLEKMAEGLRQDEARAGLDEAEENMRIRYKAAGLPPLAEEDELDKT